MKRILLSILCVFALPFFCNADVVEKAIRKAGSTLYIQTDSVDYVSLVSRVVPGNVQIHMIISLPAAKRSDRLRTLMNRGAEIRVAESYGGGTVVVADKTYIGDGKQCKFYEDSSKAIDYINDWRHRKLYTIPCR